MFGLFKKNKSNKRSMIQLVDLNGNSIITGDKVLSLRYDLGECVIVEGENGYEYESIATKKRVNWTLMIDAATERQKVEKLDS
jgi:hypothetical protein